MRAEPLESVGSTAAVPLERAKPYHRPIIALEAGRQAALKCGPGMKPQLYLPRTSDP